MNIRRLWVKLALLLAASLVVCFAVPQTLALISARSATLVNLFSSDHVPPTPVSVTLGVQKTVKHPEGTAVSLKDFKFLVENEAGETVHTLQTDEQGYGEHTFTFTESDLGTPHLYRLKELNDGRPHMTYDTAVHTLAVALEVDESNCIRAQVTLDGRQAEEPLVTFENTYAPPIIIPPTGDNSRVLLWALTLLVSAAGAGLVGRGLRRHRA